MQPGPGYAAPAATTVQAVAYICGDCGTENTLKAGDVILTGSVHTPVFLPGPGVAKTEFVGIGGTEITIQ